MEKKEENNQANNPEEALSSAEGFDWYALKVKKGAGKAILAEIHKKMKTHGLDNMLRRSHVPSHREYVMQNGKRRLKEHKFGHIAVELNLTNPRIKEILRTIEGLNGFFIFPSGYGWKEMPVPLTEEEVERMLVEENTEKPVTITHTTDALPQKGQKVEIISGVFKDMEAIVKKIDQNTGKLEVIIKVFKKDTPVELNYNQIKKK